MRRALATLLLLLTGALPAAAAPATTKPIETAKLGAELARLHFAATTPTVRRSGPDFRAALARVRDGRVLVDAVAAGGDTVKLRRDLAALGATDLAAYGRMVSAWLPVDRLDAAAALDSLAFVRPAVAVASAGDVQSQGDVALRGQVARDSFAVDGTGVTVGVLSDSYDCRGGAAADVASGDLPPAIDVVDDAACFQGEVDEGRAMLQIVHDVAPGAGLAFHTAFAGQADFAGGIVELATDAGAQVIVDDVIYLAEPMFQDGIVARAIDEVVALGVSYFSAAGNAGRRGYEAPFADGARLLRDAFLPSGDVTFFGGIPHDFGGGDVFQRIRVPEGRSLTLSVQWDSRFASVDEGTGSANDLDVYVLDDPPTTVLASGAEPNRGLDPVELVGFENPGGSGQTTFNILITRFAGPRPGRVKYVRFGSAAVEVEEHDTASATIYGHAAARGAVAVGAAFYAETPGFGVTPPRLEPYSSSGPVTILFSTAGDPVTEVRAKPEIVAADGGDTTFFFPGEDAEPNGLPNFFGTSAAAPHAAAVAALLLERLPGLAPASVSGLLAEAALDMGPPGPDADTGAGLIQADRSLALLECRGRPATMVGTSGPDVLTGTAGSDVIVALGGDDRVRARGGDDVVCGGSGDDVLLGEGGSDVLDGGRGDDRVRGGAGADRLLGGTGADRLDGGIGADVAVGGGGPDGCQAERSRGCP